MERSIGRPPRVRLLVLWIAFLSLFGQVAGLHAQDDECVRLTSTGRERDCTYLEEMRDCIDDANDSFDECVDDAAEQETLGGWFVNWVGCEVASAVNNTACAISVTADWGFGKDL
jgi:hypothetical protein